MNKEEKLKQAITHKIFKDKKIVINPEDIDSVFKGKILSDEHEKLIESYRNYFEKYLTTVHYIDNIRNPYGIYRYVRSYAEQNGTYFNKEGRPLTNEELNSPTTREKALLSISHYVPHNPNEYVIVITDHISLLSTENGENLHQAMSRYSSTYCLRMRDRWGYTVVNVQQQSAEQEKQQFTAGGKSIVDKLRPSADGLGDNKLVGRD